MNPKHKQNLRARRHNRVRAKITGTADRPRLCVFRSARFIYAQLIDDTTGKTLASVSDAKSKKSGTKTESAFAVGEALATAAAKHKIKSVVFDRGGYKYHGRVESLADGARKGGLEF